MYYSEIGFDSYDQYVASDIWREIKQFYYQHRKRYECDICGAREQIVLHKRSYKFLTLPDLKKRYRGDSTKILRYLHTYVVYLCRGCNKQVHFYADGTRVPLEYRKLRERENLVRRRTKKPELRRARPPQAKRVSFLGSYLKGLLKK